MQYLPFGDSHCLFLAGADSTNPKSHYPVDTPIINWMGPAKIWGINFDTVNKTKEKFLHFKNFLSKNPDIIPICSMGEIDIRVNLGKRCALSWDFSPISEIVDLYLKALNDLPSTQVIIWGPPPTLYESENLNYPSYFDSLSRNVLTHVFNKNILQRITFFPKIKFATIFYNFVDDNLVTTGGLLDGIHYNCKYTGLAREMIRDLSTSKSIATLDLNRFNRIHPAKFTYNNDRLVGYSNQLFELSTHPSPVRFFLYRPPVNTGTNLKNIQLRVSNNQALQNLDIGIVNNVPLLNTHEALKLIHREYGEIAISSILADLKTLELNLFSDDPTTEKNNLLDLKKLISILQNS